MPRILAIAALAAAALAAASAASDPPLPGRAPTERSGAEALSPERTSRDFRGDRLCTPTFCVRTPSHPVSTAIGFGAAVVAAGWIGRRYYPR